MSEPVFTEYQYRQAIASLLDGLRQLEADGRECSVCGDSGHQAFECRFNPLVAMRRLDAIRELSEQLHEELHKLCPSAGNYWVGASLPFRSEGEERAALTPGEPVMAIASDGVGIRAPREDLDDFAANCPDDVHVRFYDANGNETGGSFYV